MHATRSVVFRWSFLAWGALLLWGCPGLPGGFRCVDDEECSGGHVCEEGTCRQTCGLSSPCPDGQVCDLSRGACMDPVPVTGGASSSASTPVPSSSSALPPSSSSGLSSSLAASSGSSANPLGSSRPPPPSSSTGAPSSSGGSGGPSSGSASSTGGTASSVDADPSSGSTASSQGGASSAAEPRDAGPPADPRCVDTDGGVRVGLPCGDGEFCQGPGLCDEQGQCGTGTLTACTGPFHPVCSVAQARCICEPGMGCADGFCVNGQCVVNSEVQVTRDDDDAHENNSGGIDRGTGVVYLPDNNWRGGLMFRNVPVVRGSTLLSTRLWLYVHVNGESTPREDWRVQDTVNPPDIGTGNGDLTDRTNLSTALVRWEESALGEGWRPSPDMSPLLNTLLARPDWSTSAKLLLVAARTGDASLFVFRSHNFAGDFAPRMRITWLPPAQPVP